MERYLLERINSIIDPSIISTISSTKRISERQKMPRAYEKMIFNFLNRIIMFPVIKNQFFPIEKIISGGFELNKFNNSTKEIFTNYKTGLHCISLIGRKSSGKTWITKLLSGRVDIGPRQIGAFVELSHNPNNYTEGIDLIFSPHDGIIFLDSQPLMNSLSYIKMKKRINRLTSIRYQYYQDIKMLVWLFKVSSLILIILDRFNDNELFELIFLALKLSKKKNPKILLIRNSLSLSDYSEEDLKFSEFGFPLIYLPNDSQEGDSEKYEDFEDYFLNSNLDFLNFHDGYNIESKRLIKKVFSELSKCKLIDREIDWFENSKLSFNNLENDLIDFKEILIKIDNWKLKNSYGRRK